MNNYIDFEEAERLTGLNKYTLGRVKTGYLKPYIENKKFNISKFQKDKDKITDIRNEIHSLYYILIDLFGDDEGASEYLSANFGRKKDAWLDFLDVELFSYEKNDLILTWYEKKLSNEVKEELILLVEENDLKWEDYFY